MALAEADTLDEIFVEEGIYKEYNLRITKPITLSSNKAIIDGDFKGEILNIVSDHVTIKNIEFRNVPTSYTKDWAAISADRVSHLILDNLTINNAFFGIYLRKSNHCEITNNYIQGKAEKEISSGNAIHLWHCDNMLIKGNKSLNHRDGIYFEFVNNTRIENNISKNNIRYGLHFMFSNDDTYINNIFEHNGSGVAVMYSKNINMFGNTFSNNWGPAAYGLLLKEISQGNISNNTFKKNTSAIFGEGVTKMQIENNQFTQNGWAIKLLSSCADNIITGNNFIGNTFSVYTNSKRSYNIFDKNYWSEYHGYDLDKNGIGDVPHNPVSLFTFLVEKNEPALLLIKSNFISVLELAEKAVPTITPENIVDLNPKMKPYVD